METWTPEAHKRSIVTWLCVVKFEPLVHKCVNKDVARLIAGMVKMSLVGEVTFPEFGTMELKDHVTSSMFWNWSNRFRPCHGCLFPILPILSQYQAFTPLFCIKCKKLDTSFSTCHCLGHYGFSMSDACFNKFRTRYELPQRTKFNFFKA